MKSIGLPFTLGNERTVPGTWYCNRHRNSDRKTLKNAPSARCFLITIDRRELVFCHAGLKADVRKPRRAAGSSPSPKPKVAEHKATRRSTMQIPDYFKVKKTSTILLTEPLNGSRLRAISSLQSEFGALMQ